MKPSGPRRRHVYGHHLGHIDTPESLAAKGRTPGPEPTRRRGEVRQPS